MEPGDDFQFVDTADNRLGLIKEWLAHGKKPPFYFKMRLVAKGPFVAAKVGRFCCCTVNGEDEGRQHEWVESCDRYPLLACEINGASYPIQRLLKGGQLRPITESEFKFLLDAAAWDANYDSTSPLATPNQRVDFTRLKPPF